jgi:hypothetical protein
MGSASNGHSQQNMEVEIVSPVKFIEKIIAGVIFIIIVIGGVEYIKTKPTWLQVSRAQTKSKLEYDLHTLQNLDIPEKQKEKKVLSIKEKLARIDRYLGK